MKTLTESDRRFIERLGLQAQSEGFSRIAGQIWATLIVSDEPVSSSQLVDTLRVSKASVSTNTCFLERLGIVERRSIPGERQDFFAIRPHPYAALVEGQIKRLEARKEVIAEAKAIITNEQT
ncbi:MarR family transcriptional regulator, partial [Marinobacter sp.]|uniref:GbsR/MarR family transcriptional regulator n=1 Tax=Marinobacter sp. TaxID=50741 RepID=UPI000C8F7C43